MDRVISIFNILFLDMYAFLFTLSIFFGVLIGQSPVKRPTESTLEALLSGISQIQHQQKVQQLETKKAVSQNNTLIQELILKLNKLNNGK